ncbi:metal ion efflux pump, RND family, membrane fusion protein [Citrifermentans bemidjiense Bem]|uniref:Metal ion efflux pump, RND family, membrane fusion protein n=1 Tax=Citrifermentans bemidjiense (strain ATCC BAA-1014 / DSM 16622 / JCM 12645 / Bem) TaxID=404380 RepID=B5EDI1_CITBB|nr:efflux RND transporter periplasmic adaptor subunit [Citrifermentans bemidjiense]ACH39177.1 metal ion efflux pump, RND family, membrane fusion protein [Citrifermentans bemidjiense Bem]
MKQSVKVAIPIVVILVAAVAGGGYYLAQKKNPPAAKDKAAQGPVLYTCAMHPFIIKDKPGTCPICGMQLIKKVEGAQASAQEQKMLGHVSLSPTQAVMANVATVPADFAPLSKEINAVGIVQYDQSRQAKVTAWVAGRIDKLLVNTVGAYVSKGRPVAEIYSPDLVAAQQEYLLALKSREQFQKSSIQAISQGGDGLVSSARQRLKLMGVRDEQIAGLEKAGHPNIKLPIYTPLSGVVIEKMVQEGQYVNMGEPLFSIADLSSVWVEVEVYENEFAFVKVGQRVEILSQSYPGKTFSGRVSFIYPFLDPKTRTVKVRVDLANPGLKLKTDMFVNAQIKAPLGNTLVVPATALMDTGKRQVVWVESQPGMFEPRDVQVGARVGDKVQILSGLKRGDKVAASGGYLIDSESQLSAGSGGGGHEGHAGGAKAPGGTAPGAVAPAAPKKGGGMNMDDMKM